MTLLGNSKSTEYLHENSPCSPPKWGIRTTFLARERCYIPAKWNFPTESFIGHIADSSAPGGMLRCPHTSVILSASEESHALGTEILRSTLRMTRLVDSLYSTIHVKQPGSFARAQNDTILKSMNTQRRMPQQFNPLVQAFWVARQVSSSTSSALLPCRQVHRPGRLSSIPIRPGHQSHLRSLVRSQQLHTKAGH